MSEENSMHHCWFIFQDDKLLLATPRHSPQLLLSNMIVEIKHTLARQYHLTNLHHYHVHCAEITNETLLPAHIEAVPLRKALEVLGDDWYAIAVKAYMVINWDKNHQFCGRCGTHTTHRPNTFERFCQACGITFYPRISPSVIVAITKGDQILMARGYHFPPGVYGLIAGFVEPGERVEEAIQREVMEEVGIIIKNVQYFGSQAWPFPDSLMLGFTAEFADGEIDINNDEIEAAGWYRYDRLPGRPSSAISIAGKLLDFVIAKLESN